MRTLYIKMILMLLALVASLNSVAAEFASPDYEENYIPVISDIADFFGGGEAGGHIILPEEEPDRAPRVRRAPAPRPPARRVRAPEQRLVVTPNPAPRVRATPRPPPRYSVRPAPRRVRGGTCESLRPQVASVVGASHASCYLKLFSIESGCRPFLPQPAGNAGNPYAAYGLCSIERSPAIRRMNKRGPSCNDISTVENQARCCQAMMRKTPHYFGPVIHGKVPRCG